MALVRGVPDHHRGQRRVVGAGAAARPRARPRRDGRAHHRQDPAAVRVQPEQPDRHGVGRDALRRVPAPRARGRRRRAGRGLPRVRHRPGRTGRADPARRAPEPGRAADLLQGLRAGRPARGLRGRVRSRGDRRAAADPGAVRGHHRRAGGRARLARAGGRGAAAGTGSPRSWASATGCATRCSATGYDVPPTQANFVWFPLGDATTSWAAGVRGARVIVRGFAGARRPGHDRARPRRTTGSWPPPPTCADRDPAAELLRRRRGAGAGARAATQSAATGRAAPRPRGRAAATRRTAAPRPAARGNRPAAGGEARASHARARPRKPLVVVLRRTLWWSAA